MQADGIGETSRGKAMMYDAERDREIGDQELTVTLRVVDEKR
jgi:hypothetical protein